MAGKLTLGSFDLHSATFEVRYDNAYLLWDSAGKIWTELKGQFRSLTVDKAEPNTTVFVADDKYRISIHIDKFSIIDLTPKSSLDELMKTSERLTKVVTRALEIESFTRVGFRLAYVRSFKDKSSAANCLIDAGLIMVPEGKVMSIEGKVMLPSLNFVWEGDAFSARILLQAREKRIDFDSPPDVEELESVHLKKNELIYDVDYFSEQLMSKGQLDVKEWLSQIYHVIKRDSHVFMGGN